MRGRIKVDPRRRYPETSPHLTAAKFAEPAGRCAVFSGLGFAQVDLGTQVKGTSSTFDFNSHATSCIGDTEEFVTLRFWQPSFTVRMLVALIQGDIGIQVRMRLSAEREYRSFAAVIGALAKLIICDSK